MLLRLLAPFVPYITEEVWSWCFAEERGEPWIHRAPWPSDADFEGVAPTAVEEIVRWASPVIYMRRTVTRDTVLDGTRLAEGDKLALWYASGNRIAGNRIERGRYGTHLMYSHDNVVEDNRYDENVVGIFLMYSRNVAVRRNRVLRSAGAAGMGLGLKESGDLEVRENVFAGNHVCAYIDNSPFRLDEENRFERNVFRAWPPTM